MNVFYLATVMWLLVGTIIVSSTKADVTEGGWVLNWLAIAISIIVAPAMIFFEMTKPVK